MPAVARRGRPGGSVRSRRGGHRKGVFPAMWGCITSLLTVLFLTFDTTFLMISLILSLIMTGISLVAQLAGVDLATHEWSHGPAKKPNPRGSKSPRRRSGGSAPTKARKRVCSARCRRSAPKSPCSCVCGGKQWIDSDGKKQGHGSEHP